jgi:putative effector of murein hydrolase
MFALDGIIAMSVAWIRLSIGAYLISVFAYQKANYHAAMHPLIGSTLIVIGCVHLSGIGFEAYQQYAWLLAFMLGPATVALAIPLYNQLRVLVRMGWRVVLPICLGGTLAPLLAWISIYFFDTPVNLQMTMLVKSITTPLAMSTAEAIGGVASLAAVFVIITGIVGAIFGPLVFRLSGNQSHMAQGIALGSVAHAIGTSKAITISESCAAFATLAVCLNGIITAIVLPLLFA